MSKYYVESDNWSQYVKNELLTSTTGGAELLYTIEKGTEIDPAIGCTPKNFVSNYTCGNETTVKTITKNDGKGKQVKYDCKTLYDKCAGTTLTLGDDGILILSDATNPELWKSENPNITGKAVSLERYKAANGGNGDNGPKYEGNFLRPGQFLDVGEFIGSPNGTCRLEMVETKNSDDTVAGRSLQVLYNVVGCSDINPVNKDSLSTYTIPLYNRALLGRIGYINQQGQLESYPENDANLIINSEEYDNVGNYDYNGGNIGGVIPNIDSVKDCQTSCSTNDDCAGFVYNSTTKNCQLKDKSIFDEGQRVINDQSEYYIRTKNLSNELAGSSCPYDALPVSIEQWNALAPVDADGNIKELNNVNLTNRKCGLLEYTRNEMEEKENANNEFTKFKDTIVEKISLFKISFNNLKAKILKNKTALDASLNELKNTQQNIGDWNGEQLKQLEAMNEDKDLNAISQNYKNILWSILAIILIIGIIKLTRTVISSPPPASL